MRSAAYPTIGPLSEPVEEIVTTISGERVKLVSVNLIGSIHQSWIPLFTERGMRFNDVMKAIYKRAYMNDIQVRPNAEDLLNAFSMPLDRVKVVVIGQDPYPGWDQEGKRPKACGYAFATLSKETPPSLERIRTTVTNVCGPITFADKIHQNSLRGWIDQGVLLLNNTPIVYIPRSNDQGEKRELGPREKELLSFPKVAWSGFTAAICREINSVHPSCYFILVGREAHYLERLVAKSICENHPSTMSSLEFVGKCFTEIPSINWSYM